MPQRANMRGEAQVNIELPRELMDRLDEYCSKNHVKKKLVWQLAITKLLNEKERPNV